MKKFKIAVPTNDKVNIAERTGRAKGFMIFTMDNKSILESEFRVNTHKHHDGVHHEHGEHNHNEVMEILSDCQFIIVIKVGKNFIQDLKTANIKIKKTDKTEIIDAVNGIVVLL